MKIQFSIYGNTKGFKPWQKLETVSFATLASGAAIERADLEIKRVLKNIMDPNTSAKAAREVNIKIKIKPSEDRGAGEVEIQATSKLAPVTEHVTQVYIGKDITGAPEISEIYESDLFEQAGCPITPIRKEGTNA